MRHYSKKVKKRKFGLFMKWPSSKKKPLYEQDKHCKRQLLTSKPLFLGVWFRFLSGTPFEKLMKINKCNGVTYKNGVYESRISYENRKFVGPTVCSELRVTFNLRNSLLL